MAKERLEIELVTEAKQAIRNLNNYVKATGQAVKAQKTHAKASEQAGQRVGKLTKLVKSYFMEIAAGIMIARRFIKIIGSLSKAYSDQIIAEAKLTAALKATGRWTQTTEDQLKDFAREMQSTTGIADELTIAAAGIMTTFTQISTKTFPEAIEVAANMSKMFGQDLRQSAIQLGTALNDPIMGVGRLKRIGISFSVEQKKSIELFMAQNDIMSAQRVILDELELEIGGVAKAIGETYAGQVDILKSSFGDLKEQMGRTIAIGITPMLPLALQMVENFKAWITETNNLKEAKINLRKAQEGVIQMTQLELLQAEQIVAYDNLRILNIRNLIQVADGLGGTYEELSEVGAELIKQQAEEIHWRQYSINGLLESIRLKDEATEATIIETKAIKDEIEVVIEVSDAWTRWADSVRDRTDAAIAATNATEALTESTFAHLDSLSEVAIAYKSQVQVALEAAEVEAELHEQRVKDIQNYLALASDVYSQINSIVSQSYMNQSIEMENNYQKEKNAIMENITNKTEQEKALEELDEKYDKKRADLMTKQAKAEKKMAILGVIVNTALAVSKVWGQTGVYGIIAQLLPIAMGIAQIAAIKSQPIPEFAKGGSFTTSGPELIQVGDNPGGRERVTVTPESSTMGKMGNINIIMPITFGTRMIKEEFQIALDKGDVIIPERMVASR